MRTRILGIGIAAVALTAAAVAPSAQSVTRTTKKAAARTTTTAARPATTAAAATTAAPATTTAPAPAAGGKTLEDIRKRGKIVVGVKYDVPLVGLKNPVTGDVVGFDVEMAKIIAKAIFGKADSKNLELIEAISANRIPFIVDGKADIIISTFTITDARKQQIDFAGPYFVAGQDILIYKVDQSSIKGVADLNGKKVCAQTGSTSLNNLRNQAPRASLIDLPTTANCVEALKDGRVDAVSTDDILLAGFAEKFNAFALVGKPFTVENYGVGLKKGDTSFRNYLNDVIEASYKDGSWKKAFESTLGSAGINTPNPPNVDRYNPLP